MKTIAEIEDEPMLRVRRPRTFKRPVLLWCTALLFLASFAGFVAFAVFGALMFLDHNKTMGIYALAAFAFMLVARVAAAIYSRKLHCHLCHGTILHEKTCRKHQSASRIPLLGYRSPVVLSALFTGGFTCMYCGSVFRLKK